MCDNQSDMSDVKIIDGRTLLILLNEYINECQAATQAKGSSSRFPNFAGFCRFCCFGENDLEEISKEFPKEYGFMCSVFEDEALNSDIPTAIVTAYLKNHFGYGEKSSKSDETKVDSGQIQLVFEHDIFADGE